MDVVAAQLAANTVQKALGPKLYQPTHLRRWAAKRAQAFTTAVYVGCAADSLGAGAYASTVHDSSDTSKNEWRDKGWVGILRARLSRDFGYAGLGASTFVGDEPAFAVTAGAPVATGTIGPMQTGYRLAAGDSITLSTAACTAVDLIGWFTTGANPFTYTVDGGPSITAANGALVGGTDVKSFYREQITGLPNIPHTIVVSGPATGFAYLSQWFARSATTGVFVSRMGKSGSTSDVIASATAGVVGSVNNQQRMLTSMFARPGSVTDLAIIMLGYNDGALQGTNGLTPTLYRSNMKAATDYVTAAGGCSLIVAAPRSSNESTPYTQQNFYDAAHDLANTDDHVAYLDVAQRFGTYAQAAAVGYQWGSGLDPIHPTAAGHAAIAETIHKAIMSDGIVNA